MGAFGTHPAAKGRLPFLRPRHGSFRPHFFGPRRGGRGSTLALVWGGSALLPVGRLAWAFLGQWRRLDGRATARAREAAYETRKVVVRGYEGARQPERVLFGMTFSIVAAMSGARTLNYLLEQRQPPRPLANLGSDRNIHHFLPGIALAFVSGALGLMAGNGDLRAMLSLPLGVGVGLALDESALLLEVEDVYWRGEQLAVAEAVPLAAAAALIGVRFIGRGARVAARENEAERVEQTVASAS